MDLRQLNSFITIVESKSFTRAAEQLHIAQPALGLQIRKLEEELQVQLLLRHSRGVEVTDAGTVLLGHARAMLERAATARRELAAFSGPPRGRVMLGLTPSINYMISAKLILQSSKQLPDVSLAIEEQLSASLLEWVALERLDMCLAHKTGDHPNVSFEPLFREHLYFICRCGLLPDDQRTIRFADIEGYSLIMPGPPHGLRQLVESQALTQKVTLNVSFEMQSVSIVRDLVAGGVGATILPYGGARRSVDAGGLVAIRIVEPEISREIFLCHVERRGPSPAAEHVPRLIQEYRRPDNIERSRLLDAADLKPPIRAGLVGSLLRN